MMPADGHALPRSVALLLAAASMAAMLYIALYQSRVVEKMWCPLMGGCEAVADAPFARPYGIPDGYLGAGLYIAIFVLLLVPPGHRWSWLTLLVLGTLATYANIKGVVDMARLGAFCTYCVFTTTTSPVLLWLIWRLRSRALTGRRHPSGKPTRRQRTPSVVGDRLRQPT